MLKRSAKTSHASQFERKNGESATLPSRLAIGKSSKYAGVEMVLAAAFLLRLCINGSIFTDMPFIATAYSLVPLIIAVFVFYIAYKGNVYVSPYVLAVFAFVGFCMVCSISSLPLSGSFETSYFNFVLYFFIASLFVLRIEQWECVFRRVAFVLLLLIVVNLALQHEEFFIYFGNLSQGHPIVSTLFEGGVNIEATWLGVFGVFFHRNKEGVLYLVSCLLLSALYSSRAGLIACILAALYVFLIKDARHVGRNILVAACSAAGLLLLLLAIASVMNVAVLDRLFSIGSEPGSLGRLGMWAYASDALFDIPFFGVGSGNAVDELMHVSENYFGEDNVHNVYLQVLLDFGPVALCFLLALLALFLRSAVKGRFQNPFAAFVSIYFILAFIQFSGPEPLLALALGAFVGMYNRGASPVAEEYRDGSASASVC